MTKAESFAMQYGFYDKEKKRACCVGYNAGYKQAEKDTIDRACKWIEENVVIYPHLDNKPLCIVNLDTFRKAMEEEQ